MGFLSWKLMEHAVCLIRALLEQFAWVGCVAITNCRKTFQQFVQIMPTPMGRAQRMKFVPKITHA